MYFLSNEFIEVETYSLCGGTLIDRNTVVTVAHCAPALSFNYTYKSKVYNLLYQSNTIFPTIESTYTVYFGVHEISFTNNSTIKVPVSGTERRVSIIIRVI